MAKKRSSSLRPAKASKGDPQPEVSSNCYEGERLDHLLLQLTKSIESAKLSRGELPDKIWIKQQFAIGVNDVTRVLERMIQEEADCQSMKEHSNINLRRAPLVPLQASIDSS